jgi:hypothetical protein
MAEIHDKKAAEHRRLAEVVTAAGAVDRDLRAAGAGRGVEGSEDTDGAQDTEVSGGSRTDGDRPA